MREELHCGQRMARTDIWVGRFPFHHQILRRLEIVFIDHHLRVGLRLGHESDLSADGLRYGYPPSLRPRCRRSFRCLALAGSLNVAIVTIDI